MSLSGPPVTTLKDEKESFQKVFSSLPRKDLGCTGRAILKFRASIHYHVPKLRTPARLKNTIRAFVCSECCIVVKSCEQLSVMSGIHVAAKSLGVKICSSLHGLCDDYCAKHTVRLAFLTELHLLEGVFGPIKSCLMLV